MRGAKTSNPGTAAGKQLYEDSELIEDEAKLAAKIDEKRRVEDALRPMSMDINSNNDGGALTKNNSSQINPATEAGDRAAEE